jgi:hypothetical protein
VSEFFPTPEPSGVPVVVLPSRMLWSKGVAEFVQAARLVKANGVQARCVLVGTVDKKNPSTITEAQLRCWEDEGVVEWWGHCDDMARVFAASHAVVLPSYGEGLPKSLLEGAACARPLIATRVRGCQEIVRDGENGLLVPPRDAQKLADAIMTLLHNKAMRERMGARGREIVMKEFRAELITEATVAVYRRLLGIAGAASLDCNDAGIRSLKDKRRGAPTDRTCLQDKGWGRFVKRGLDLIAAVVGLIVLAPLFVVVAVLIKADSPGPVFFRQERIGKGFRAFWMYKFRTMVKDAPLKGGALTAIGDPRVTRFGRILRKKKIDELPQLINILRGDMSLVGPRPEVRR